MIRELGKRRIGHAAGEKALFGMTFTRQAVVPESRKTLFGITFARQFGSYPEGVSFSILLMNIVTPYIDRFTMTKPIGAVKEAKEK